MSLLAQLARTFSAHSSGSEEKGRVKRRAREKEREHAYKAGYLLNISKVFSFLNVKRTGKKNSRLISFLLSLISKGGFNLEYFSQK